MAEIDAVLRKGMEGILKLNDDICTEIEEGVFSCGGSVTLEDGYENRLAHEIFSADLLITLHSVSGKQIFAGYAEILGMPHGTSEIVFRCEIAPKNKKKMNRVKYMRICLIDEVNTHLHARRYENE